MRVYYVREIVSVTCESVLCEGDSECDIIP